MKTTYPTHPIRDYNTWIESVYNYFRMNVSEYVRNKTIRAYTPFKIIDGKGFYIIDGKMIPQREFEKQFPLPLVLNKINENPDKSKDFMNDLY